MSIKIIQIDLSTEDLSLIDFLNINVNDNIRHHTFKWQYTEAPHDVIFFMVKDDDKIISTASFIPYSLLFDKEFFLTAKGESFFLDPDYRSTPIFPAVYKKGLIECEKKNMSVVWGFSPIYKFFLGKTLFHVYGDIMFDFRAIVGMKKLSDFSFDSQIILRYPKHLASFLISGFLHWKSKMISRYKSKINEYSVKEKLPDTSLINDLFAKIPGVENIVRLDMDNSFLEWRVYNNPNLIYKTHFFFKNNVLEGFYFYSINEKKLCVQLVEFVFINNNTGNVMACHLINKMKKEKASFLEYFGNIKNKVNLMAFSILQKHVFGKIYLNKGMDFIQKITPETKNFPIENWYINGLWTQGYDR